MRLTEMAMPLSPLSFSPEWNQATQISPGIKSFYEWLAAGQFKLQRVLHSRVTQAMEVANRAEQWIRQQASEAAVQIFLVQHDWAAAFSGDSDFDDKTNSCRLPAPKCCFEFTVSSRHVLAFTNETLECLFFYVQLPELKTWSGCDAKTLERLFFARGPVAIKAAVAGHDQLYDLIYSNIRAACVALEAEIAETEIVRALDKLNKSLIRHGRIPKPDFNIINLANRKRYAPVPDDMRDDEDKRHVRLHFRRGHLRHYAKYNLWIKWQLVGSPDLGFIDHDYKL